MREWIARRQKADGMRAAATASRESHQLQALVSNHDLLVVISFLNQESLSPIFAAFIVRV